MWIEPLAAKLITLILIGIFVIIMFTIFKKVLKLILNAIIGLVALFAFNAVFGTDVAVNFWSVVITALGGIVGFIVVIVLHFLGVAF
ncbi:MAG: pro-sigmaK processing inhibitor BofA family protein [Nanoarchaeota archaeon]|nr:pro-sigmaK processing inhibitor BofA family protein [Nanoarchaeota archaeon]